MIYFLMITNMHEKMKHGYKPTGTHFYVYDAVHQDADRPSDGNQTDYHGIPLRRSPDKQDSLNLLGCKSNVPAKHSSV